MAGLVLSVAIAGGSLLTNQQGEPTPAPSPPREHPSPARAAESLQTWVQALAGPSVASARSLAPDGDTRAADLLASIAENAQAMGLTDLSARYVDRVGTVRADGTWSAAVALTWQVGGFHARPAHTEVVVRFAPDGERLGIVGFGGESHDERRTPLWLQEQLTVVREKDLLVAVAGDRAQARGVTRRARRGIAVVSEVLPNWEPSVVVQVPSAPAVLEEALGAEPGTYANVAAVTARDGEPARRAAPTSIYLNPVHGSTGHGDDQAVLTHEITHLATRAATSRAPLWLVEGFADVVALRGTTVPEALLLRQATAAVRRGGLPTTLPGRREFDPGSADLGATYELAWLACQVIVEHVGTRGLVDLYERVESGTALPAALRLIGLPLPRLTERWRARLSDLAG